MKKSNLIFYSIIVMFLFFQNITIAQKNIIKGSLTAPLFEHVEFSYERLINSKASLEFKLGIIGIGPAREKTQINFEGTTKTVRKVPSGFFVNAGYRMYHPFDSEKETRNLNGLYLQPDLIIGSYKSYYRDTGQTRNVNYQAFMLNGGYQGVISGRFICDAYIGLGIGNDNQPKENEDSFLYFGESLRGVYKFKTGVSAAMKAGIKIGYIF